MVNDAEATLQAFQRARADYHSLDPVRAAASRILSEQETKVAGAHKKLAEAIHKFDTLWLQLADLHGQIQCAQVEAELVYRTRNLAVRTEPPPKAWLEQGETVKTVPAAAVAGLDHTGVEAARAALAATAYDQEHAQALAALNAHAEAIANRVADGLAQYQDAVFHDCQSPATMSLSRSGSPKLAPVADLRRNPLEGSAGA